MSDEQDLLDVGFTEIRRKMIKNIDRIPSQIARRKGVFAHFNFEGSYPPLFWCFNNWAEAVFLAYWLGPERPLYAMQSFYGLEDDRSVKEMYKNYVAEHYANLVLDVHPKGHIFIGGNCQSAPIAESMAHYLMDRTATPPILISLDHLPFYCYPGCLVMLFGLRSEYNPFLKEGSPISGWFKKHKSPSWGFIDAEHGQYFREPGIHELVGYIKTVMDMWVGEGIEPREEIRLDKVSSLESGK